MEHNYTVGGRRPLGELADLLVIDRRLAAKVEADEIADKREACQPNAHLDPALMLAGDLAFAKQCCGRCSNTRDWSLGIDRQVGNLLPLAFLAPCIIDAIVGGNHPRS